MLTALREAERGISKAASLNRLVERPALVAIVKIVAGMGQRSGGARNHAGHFAGRSDLVGRVDLGLRRADSLGRALMIVAGDGRRRYQQHECGNTSTACDETWAKHVLTSSKLARPKRMPESAVPQDRGSGGSDAGR